MKPFSFNKKIIIICVLGFCEFSLLPAQTADEIETLLEVPAVTYAQAARMAVKASDAAAISDLEEAFAFAAERNWLPKNASPDSAARLDGVSLLFMQVFGIKGGLFYSLIKNPHYAYRELERRNVFRGKSDPRMTVSGDYLLFITGRVLSITEGE